MARTEAARKKHYSMHIKPSPWEQGKSKNKCVNIGWEITTERHLLIQ